MDKTEIISYINRIEERYPVDTWKVGDILVWPLLRIRLAGRLFEHSLREDPVSCTSALSNAKQHLLHYGLVAVRDLPATLASLWKLWRFHRGINFLHLASAAHRTQLPIGWFNRFIDPLIIQQNAQEKKSLLLEYEGTQRYHHPRVHESLVVSMQSLTFFFYIIGRISYRLCSPSCSLHRYKDFLAELRGEGFSAIAKEFAVNHLAYRSTVIKHYSHFYQWWLQRLRPTCIFVVCYYSFEAMVLSDAAHRLDIPTIDIQHGTQDPLHTSYAQWLNVPTIGYSLLPTIFWSWDAPSAMVVQSWAKHTTVHRSFIGGNPWLSYWQQRQGHEQSALSSKPIVLYSLQPISQLFPPFLLDVIRTTHADYSWWIRLHPRQLDEQATIVEKLRSLGVLEYVNVEEATHRPLLDILSQTCVHITQWSSVIWEAYAYGVPSIVIHPSGRDMFTTQLSSNTIYYIQDSSKMGQLISQLAQRKSAHHRQVPTIEQSLHNLDEFLKA